MGGKRAIALCTAALALSLLGCVRTVEDKSPPPTIPKEEEKTKFDLPPHHFIYRGMDTDRVESLVGEPQHTEKAGAKDVWYYEWGSVLLEDGKVAYKYPPSRGVEDRGEKSSTPAQKKLPRKGGKSR